MSDYSKHAAVLREWLGWTVLTEVPDRLDALTAAIALCEAAAGGEDEREHCESVAYEHSGHDAQDDAYWRFVDMIARERAAARAEAGAKLAELRAEFAQYQKDQRPPGCQCTYEFGDSPCPAHPTDPDTELPYEPAKLLAQRDELMRGQPGMDAFNEIAKLCGCPEWDYPGQLVRDVAKLAAERDQLREALKREREANQVIWGVDVSALRAKLARVEALVDRLREAGSYWAADRLEETLRDEDAP